MELTREVTLPRAPSEVLERFVDPAYHERKLRAIGAVEVSRIEARQEGAGTRLVSRRTVEVAIPRALARIVRPTNVVEDETFWEPTEGGARGRYETRVRTAPVTVLGSLALREAPGGTAYEIRVSVTSRIPLVGRAIERLAEREALRSIEREFAFHTRALLAS